MHQKSYAQAEQTFRQCIPLVEQSGLIWEIAFIHWHISQAQLYQKHFQGACDSSLLAIHTLQNEDEATSLTWYCLLNLAAAIANENMLGAARLHGKAFKEIQISGEELMAQEIRCAEEILKAARARMGETQYAQAQAEGVRMSLEVLLAGVAAGNPAQIPSISITAMQSTAGLTPHKAEKARFSGLTAREREVAIFIAQGFSNPAMAAQMTLSERTITTHVGHILTKLGYTSRTQIAAWAVEIGLVSIFEH